MVNVYRLAFEATRQALEYLALRLGKGGLIPYSAGQPVVGRVWVNSIQLLDRQQHLCGSIFISDNQLWVSVRDRQLLDSLQDLPLMGVYERPLQQL